MMREKKIRQIERRIDRIKKALQEIGPMRPGSLTRQFRDPKERVGPYWQISYTRQMKSRTEYIRKEWVVTTRKQIATYKRFKRLVDEWVNLSIELSQLRMRIEKEKGT
jgi:hypothetical protein